MHTPITVDPKTWQVIKSLVDGCLELPLSNRDQYLGEQCTDAAVRAEVISLLQAYEESEAFLDNASEIACKAAAEIMKDERKIGPYRLIDEIGRGGMGTVYRAFRDDDAFQIVVALKVVSRGMDTDMVLKRFRTERQILASLDHPYIARILDGGTTKEGLPYFVMEYVDGQPLTRYCDKQRLSISERLALFRKVSEAIAYAHQNLVVHRDLKPGNILITADGTPKLLDFGIAKILGNPEDPSDTTRTAFRMATPAYASPEQISGGLTGTASDVYSMGVILYELLTGHPPYRLASTDSESLAKVIREREPTRASSVVSFEETIGPEGNQSTIDPQEVARKRRTTVDALRRRLRGDLDNIVSMALRKESQRRYGSVEQLSEDVRRHLDGLPVAARKDTCWYRAGKFAVRHRRGLALTVAAGILLCVTSTMALWNAWQLRQRVAEDHKLASLFLVDVHDAIAKLPGSTPAREVLLGQSLKYLNNLANDTSNDQAMQRSLALAYERFAELQAGGSSGGLGRASAGLETFHKGEAIRERIARQNPTNVKDRFALAESHLLGAVIQGRVGGAEKRIDYNLKALKLLQELSGTDSKNVSYRSSIARAHTGIAYGLSNFDKWQESRDHLLKALEIRKSLLAEAPGNERARRSVALNYYRLGVTYAQANQPNEALEHLESALSMTTGLIEDDRQNRSLVSDLASIHHFIGRSMNQLKRHENALTHLNASVSIREGMLAEDDLEARTKSLLAGNYAERSTAYLKMSRLEDALREAQRALELQNQVLKLDPRGVPVRFSAADFSSRLANVHLALAESGNDASRETARSLLSKAIWYYTELKQEGHLSSASDKRHYEDVKANLAKTSLDKRPHPATDSGR